MNSISAPKPDNTVTAYLDQWVRDCPERTWLQERSGDDLTEWTWQRAHEEIHAVAAWLESEFGEGGAKCAILSRNRAHWVLADMAIAASGNVGVPLFTTLATDTARYILDFAEVKLLFLGEAQNWEQVGAILPEHVEVVALPGIELQRPHLRWEDLVEANSGKRAHHRCREDELFSIVFTSGTTGVPKGVMQTHRSMLVPMQRCRQAFNMRSQPRFLSYLPLAHVAERQLVMIQSLLYGGQITFNESLQHLIRDMADARPSYFFGPPRVWEQLQQFIVSHFGSQQALDQALQTDAQIVIQKVRNMLGLQDTDYLLTAAAPTPSSLIHWFERLGLTLLEGFGQTEAMGLIANSPDVRRIGTIGKPVEGVEVRIADSGELLCKADGLSPGYYRMPEKTSETFVDGWVHTGDKARVDDEGFYYITGRVKDYFKTIQGKFVAPFPVEDAFAECQWVEQQCLLGRGYSKTVMTCVLSETARQRERALLEQDLLTQLEAVNRSVEKHARIGAVIVSSEPWSIENGLLTPTLKLRREAIEERFGERARELSRLAAEQGEFLIEWEMPNEKRYGAVGGPK